MTHPNPKHTILPAILLFCAAPQLAHAQSAPSLSGLYACEALTTPDAQLSCFRAETAKLRAREGLAAPVDNLAAEREAAALRAQGLAAERDRLALETERLAVEKERAALEAQRLAAVKKEDTPKPKAEKKAKTPRERTVAIREASARPGSGYIRFTLENGEVWQQSESGRVRLGKGSPDVLVIKKASFGSFIGKVNDRSPSFRMKRIK